MAKRTNTTKDIGLLRQLHDEGQLRLAPEFQRNAVWPKAAKAYLIDTILEEKPMPLFFFQRGTSAQTGKTSYDVVDGQQRLRAIFEFMDDQFSLTESRSRKFRGKYFSNLSPAAKDAIRDYDLSVQELSGYSDREIRDIFVRMNKYVVKLSPQELRHAREQGAFFEFIESFGRHDFWFSNKVMTKSQNNRMRNQEFAAEISILLIEGPQDKKASIDLYYREFQAKFPLASEVMNKFVLFTSWVQEVIPSLPNSRFRKPTDLYSLIAAIDRVSRGGKNLKKLDSEIAKASLAAFERQLRSKRPSRQAASYLVAASQQTDNIGPRNTRTEILASVLVGG
jgi:hypothetical protein